ncbi:RNA polymerase sigma factor sigD, chloroplastic [Typha angustifolia]|uniref:RNA polymerase sigma factor sigD, chloroplastic n=1 Tax=Typha angustifolia TaxID=59011 RepID=UPI003C2B3961
MHALSLPLHHSVLPRNSLQISQQQQQQQHQSISLLLPSSALTTHNSQLVVIQDDSLAITAAAAEALSLALTGGILQESAVLERRKQRRCRRRRKRRKNSGLSSDDEEDEDGNVFDLIEGRRSSRTQRSGYLTARQEAEFSRYLKEEALLETASMQMEESAPSNSGIPAASAWMKKTSRDKALLRARESKERIILSYKRLVVSIATAYQGKGLSIQDLIQEGCIGLIRGAQRFDHKKGYKLSTYVYWWIKQAIVKAIVNKSRIVRLPGNLCEGMNKVTEATATLRRRLRRSPTYEEIADFLEISVSSVRIICEKSRHPISIDQPVNGEGATLKDIIAGPDESRPEPIIARKLALQNLEKLLKKLSPREEYIIRLRYGLNGESARSCDEIGRLLNLSRERIRQIHCTAIARLREERSLIENS